MRARDRVRMTRRLLVPLLVTLDALVGVTGIKAARAEGWVNIRIPVAAHFGPPGRGFESGLHADFLSVFPVTSAQSRLGLGPYVEMRTLGVSHLGFGGGLEVLALPPGRAAFGLGAETGFSKWLNVADGGEVTAHMSLSLQLRSGRSGGGFVHTTALFVRAGRSIESDHWESTVGLQFGGDPIFSFLAASMQSSGW